MNPVVIAVLSALSGVVVKSLLDLLADDRRYRRETQQRLRLDRQSAYVEFMAALDDLSDAIGDRARGIDVTDRRADCLRRLNRAFATVDLLSSQTISDLASEAYDVSELAYEDEKRIARMESLITAFREDLDVKQPEWTQRRLAEGSPAPRPGAWV